MFVFLLAIFVFCGAPFCKEAVASYDFEVIEDEWEASVCKTVTDLLEESKNIVSIFVKEMIELSNKAASVDTSHINRAIVNGNYCQTLNYINSCGSMTRLNGRPILKESFDLKGLFPTVNWETCDQEPLLHLAVQIKYPLTSKALELPERITTIQEADAALPFLRNALKKVENFYTINTKTNKWIRN